jgi:hypothetical protein
MPPVLDDQLGIGAATLALLAQHRQRANSICYASGSSTGRAIRPGPAG